MNKSAPLVDAYLHKGLREKLVILLREKGITDENVLTAIGKIPRHFFLDSAFDKIAYEDRAFPIAADQTISQPYTVAYQTQLERQKQLFDKTAKYVFKDLYLNVQFFFGDGFEGLPDLAPFDKILITAAAPHLPEKLWAQLKTSGKMVIPLDESETAQRMMRLTKKRDGSVKKEAFDQFSFVPMLQGKTQK
ncbi:MAG: protein-L-isoaspartate O-methyltransferase [Chitinophagia bacterium]|nr:protein-L-isoaspartate O-methyltransferase [Chitinophagia bacterium]